MDILFWSIIIIALLFDFLNGMNDAANAVATVISSKVLKPLAAVGWAAAFNFIAYFIFGTAVAGTIGKGVVQPGIIDDVYLLSALIGAGSWMLIATLLGLPVSASHALIGGLIGPGLWMQGIDAIVADSMMIIVLFMALSPLIGFILAHGIQRINQFVLRKRNDELTQKQYGRLQLLSSALLSLGHGGNDAQKTMGIIAVLLFNRGITGPEFYVPTWLALTCYSVLALGTLAGGWKVIETLGQNLTQLTKPKGFAAESAAALTLAGSTWLGIPVSTTHTITGAIVGTGTKLGEAKVSWKLAGRIALAWLLTMPFAGGVSIACFLLIESFSQL